MGRSVSHPSGAIVAFADVNVGDDSVDNRCKKCDARFYYGDERCETCGAFLPEAESPDHFDWHEAIDWYRDWIKETFPSFEPCDKWLGREDHAIAENRFAWFGISEYCGLVAIWLVAKDYVGRGEGVDIFPLGQRWLAQVEPRFLKTFGQLRKLGTFSNGEGVFERIEA